MIESQKFRVWNTTRDTLLCAEITAADAGHEDLDGLILSIVTTPGAGLWLRPCLGAPLAEGAPPFDMVCISKDCAVVEQYESYVAGSFVLFQPGTTGALILPARTIAASQTKVGDSLDIMLPEDELLEEYQASGNGAATSPEENSAMAAQQQSHVAKPAISSSSAARVQSGTRSAVASTAMNDQVLTKKKDSLGVRFLRWLVPDRRKDDRHPSPNLTAHRWSGDQMYTYLVEDVSTTGIYVVTEERPFRGTIFMVTLKKKTHSGDGDPDSISVQGKVVRWGENGLGLEFITSDGVNTQDASSGVDGGATSVQLRRFLQSV